MRARRTHPHDGGDLGSVGRAHHGSRRHRPAPRPVRSVGLVSSASVSRCSAPTASLRRVQRAHAPQPSHHEARSIGRCVHPAAADGEKGGHLSASAPGSHHARPATTCGGRHRRCACRRHQHRPCTATSDATIPISGGVTSVTVNPAVTKALLENRILPYATDAKTSLVWTKQGADRSVRLPHHLATAS